MESRSCWLPSLAPLCAHHPAWFSVCECDSPGTERTSLQRCKKKKSFLLIAHALTMRRFVLSSPVFTTAGAFLHPSRAILYFLQQSAENQKLPHVALTHIAHGGVQVVRRSAREHTPLEWLRLSQSESLHLPIST